MSSESPRLRFPYMFWAHEEACVSPYCLSQSGMPAPDPAVLGLSGPPDLSPPPTEALPAFEARLAELFGVEPERVLATAGTSGAMHLAAMRFFPGSRVVTELPSYEAFRALSELYARDWTAVERRPENGWRLDPDELGAALAGGSPAHLFLCNPHNPTGAVHTADEIRVLAAAAERAGGLLISNEIYMEFAQPEERVHAFALAPRALSLGSLTKAYGLGPLRLGWIVLGEGLVDERESLLDHAYLVGVDPPTPVLRAGRAALDHLPELLAPVRRLEAESRPLLSRWLTDSDAVSGTLGPLGLSTFPRVAGVEDTRTLQRYLAAEEGVDVVPGEFFGRPGHLRLGYGLPPATLETALEHLQRGLESFPGRR